MQFFSSLPALQVFGCASNKLTGTLPADLASATELIDFEAYENDFTGSLDVFSALKNFSGRLDLHYNKFTGTLPESMPHPISYISVANNDLSGTIPQDWSDLHNLGEH